MLAGVHVGVGRGLAAHLHLIHQGASTPRPHSQPRDSLASNIPLARSFDQPMSQFWANQVRTMRHQHAAMRHAALPACAGLPYATQPTQRRQLPPATACGHSICALLVVAGTIADCQLRPQQCEALPASLRSRTRHQQPACGSARTRFRGANWASAPQWLVRVPASRHQVLHPFSVMLWTGNPDWSGSDLSYPVDATALNIALYNPEVAAGALERHYSGEQSMTAADMLISERRAGQCRLDHAPPACPLAMEPTPD